MKPTTEVFLAYRNVGDSKDKGTVVGPAPLKEQLLVLIQYLGSATMATRFDFGIGRSESDARRSIESERANNKAKQTQGMMAALSDALASMGVSENELDETGAPDLSGDDGWTPPKPGWNK